MNGAASLLVSCHVAIAAAVCACGSNPQNEGTKGTDDAGDGGADVAESGAEASSDADGGMNGVIAVPLTACTPLLYTADVAIGGSQHFHVWVDTGSTTLGVAASTCSNCSGTAPRYQPDSTATDQKMAASSQYATGSWSGEIYQDSVGFASEPSVPLNFVAISSQAGFFIPGVTCGTSGYQGVIGFARSASALPDTGGFFDQYVAAKGIENVFATEFCDNGGTLWLGGFDPRRTTASPQYVPVTGDHSSNYVYTVNLTSISIASTTVAIATSSYADTLLDTGTSQFVLSTAAFHALAAAIAASPGFRQLFGPDAADAGTSWFSSMTPCTTAPLTKAQIDAALPPLTLTFGSNPGISVQALPSESYFMPYGGVAWCSSLYAIDPSADFPFAADLGGPVLRSNIVIFDRAKGRIGFAPHAPCAP
jgi:hypothetical protein